MPRELIGSLATYLRLRRVLRRSPEPVAATAGAARVTYLRPAPTLRWMGEYVGGAATHTTGVINGFVANGLGVRVFAPERPQGTERAEFTPVPLRRVFQLAQWMTSTAYSRDVADAAESAPADLVYQRYTLGSYAGVELARRLGLPLVLEWNGSEVWTIRHWGSGRLPLADTLVDMERHNLEAAALIVVVSDVLRDQLVDEGVPAERVLVNPNGVDVDALARLRERSAAEWRVVCEQPDVPTIGFIGTFGLWHGVTVLPAMVAAVAKHRPEARWILIGDGRLFDEVRRDLEARGMTNRVFMPGVVPHQRALELLAASDVTVSPHIPNPDGTRFFGSPTKLFEYMGLAKPIVASDLEQIGQVIEHERTGLLCPPGDAEAAAAAVVRLLVDRGLAESLGEAALESARTTYSWEQHVRRILDAL
jgi:glycosyltransferase involved in cell wall biosynthesis